MIEEELPDELENDLDDIEPVGELITLRSGESKKIAAIIAESLCIVSLDISFVTVPLPDYGHRDICKTVDNLPVLRGDGKNASQTRKQADQ